ncbi:unnamed protein product [Arctia plantaginis]|uniref:Uncharacterized protein n=1 Tax=Arctia plantaginis TaxID=874455 RepID=A0A8S1AN36_ARCPL|nr:unnamed protein product [Arctia plantaginis]
MLKESKIDDILTSPNMLPPPPPPLPQEENNTSETRAIATQGLSPARPRPSALGRRGGRSARRGGGKRYSRDSVGVRQQCDDECEQQRRAAGARPERAHGARVECGRPGWRARRTAALPPSATARARAPPRPAPRPPPSIAPPRYFAVRPEGGDTSFSPSAHLWHVSILRIVKMLEVYIYNGMNKSTA